MSDIFFNPAYAKLYKDIDGVSDTFVYECCYGKITNTFIYRRLPWMIDGQVYYDIVTPYGYGGPLAEDVTNIKALMAEYRQAFDAFCKKKNIICEFIRFHLYDNVDVRANFYGGIKNLRENVVVDTTGDYENKIWMGYEHKVRKNVKKALRNGLSIIIENNLNHIDNFLEIYNCTMDRNHAEDYYYFKKTYFETMQNLLSENFMYFYVEKDGKICSAELVLRGKKYAYSFLGGTLVAYYEYRPNDFLKNEIIKWCNREGIEKFILGGGYHQNDGIYMYKRCFTSGPDIPFYIGEYIFNQAIYDKAVEMRKKTDSTFNLQTEYFPKYRG